MARRFDASYREEAVLRDGSRVLLRLLRPSDRDLLLEGFRRLSNRARYQRFFVPKAYLQESEVRYLVDVDQEDHFALGAVRQTDGQEVGLGIGRFVRLRGRPDAAEAAITVVDDAQGKGLGSLLLRRLEEAARERGVRYFHCELLASNAQMAALLKALEPHAVLTRSEGSVRILEFDLEESELQEFLRIAAREFEPAD